MGVHHIAAQRGTVTRAARTERQPASGLTPNQAVTALREDLETYIAAGGYSDLAVQMDVERHRICDLRQTIANGLEADFAILNALAPDPNVKGRQDAEDVTLAIRGGLAS